MTKEGKIRKRGVCETREFKDLEVSRSGRQMGEESERMTTLVVSTLNELDKATLETREEGMNIERDLHKKCDEINSSEQVSCECAL